MALLYLLALVLLLNGAGWASPSYSNDASPSAQEGETPKSSSVPVVESPYLGTPHKTVLKMLEMAKVDKDDLVYDLGSGDGRIVIAAARDFGARGVGIEIDPKRVAEAENRARDAGVTDRVRFIHGDLFDADLRSATAVTVYLLPAVNRRLRPKLLDELKPGTPVVSYDFDMGEWEPDDEINNWFVFGIHGNHRLFLWIVPAKVDGTWLWKLKGGTKHRAELTQRFQKISGKVGNHEIRDASLSGDAISFKAGGLRYSGRVVGDSIRGTVRPVGGGRKKSWLAHRDTQTAQQRSAEPPR